ncbi:hypothetical protein EJB05_11685 [Eragrostis curvula]|uniref:GDSL esterase/lipase n=1 Tax=Eragrostis curvula TaxID=38414 RepID=A0A5J9VPM8_9POAL|nr:hypothetical protein EJB05_11685 [Eragrostis curvula]
MKVVFAVVCAVLLLLNAGQVESRSHGGGDRAPPKTKKQYKLFVFGDSFADNGNYPMADLTAETRAWYYPYGTSDYEHGTSPTGRFSDAMVQPDFLARILGKEESPPAERRRDQDGVDPFGMNFAVGSAGIVAGSRDAPNFGTQVDSFRRLVRHGIINKDLTDSVALVAFSGKRDYARVSDMTVSQIDALARNVTSSLAGGVEQLLKLGVSKVLVDALPPLGCTPWLSRPNGYGGCDANLQATSLHNAYLNDKVFKYDDVFMLDLKTVFTDFVLTNNPDAGSRGKRFKYKLEPCCDSFDEAGFCGQMEDGKKQYMLCPKPDKHFYWDDMNPTQAGWKAVMEELEDPIKHFLEISS